MTTVLLEVTGLSCRRGGRPVFAGLSFALTGGELLALTGRNGSGKTTLLRALAQLVTAEAGQIRWQGEDVARDREAWRRQIAWLGHLDGLKGDLSVRENLSIAAKLRDEPRRSDRPGARVLRSRAPGATRSAYALGGPAPPRGACSRGVHPCAGLAARRTAECARCAVAGGVASDAGPASCSRRPRHRRDACADRCRRRAGPGAWAVNTTVAPDPSVADRALSHEVRKYRRATSPCEWGGKRR